MTSTELKDRKKGVNALYNFAIKVREDFERLLEDQPQMDDEAACERLSSLIFNDGTAGDDSAALGV